MSSRSKTLHTDTERVARWAANLIEDLGPDLRQCLEWMHDSDPQGLTTVLRSMRRCCVNESIAQGASLYWARITARKRGQQPAV